MIDWLRRSPAEPSITLAGRVVPVNIRRHPTARRMTLRLAPDGSEIRLTLPRWGRTEDGLDFAASRRGWLEAQLAGVPDAAAPQAGGSVFYRGEELALLWDAKAKRRPALTGAGIVLGGPEEGLAARLRRWLEAEAATLMADDLGGYCTLIGRAAPPLRLSRAQRRWGSCANDGTIRLNWRLIQAPDFVRRSVVAHEVAHLAHFDHSPAFHALLGELYEGDITAANRWLKQHGRTLYTRFG
ncbi:MAG: SprT family zinc-dependent metalloprotease [Candidatus Andeanibacterium colombiense]|uniref:SprT family zinc-dependent metalloprotease n=1 Tax=Candidatus Andeanibacterium colombiense TaxID=3121345 RepID=A0AAJ5X7F4_9SPHN|nr:MAG: SprT family zinc-dependent metalloprotease [Sphingomonadaceae bacterium]